MNTVLARQLQKSWTGLRPRIETRLREFTRAWETGSDKDIFAELVFCIFTPQSKARSCWAAVENLKQKDLLLNGTEKQIQRELNGVRFKYNKTRYALLAKNLFFSGQAKGLKRHLSSFSDDEAAREWLVSNVKGIGYKEATHFLRNIGRAKNLAILDRHILRNLAALRVIGEVPGTLSKKHYFGIEQKMRIFSSSTGIPMNHLDLVMWYEATGDIFK